MEDKMDKPKSSAEESAQALSSSSSLSENLNRKYPYLTAYVGFIVLYLLAGVAASLIFTVPNTWLLEGIRPSPTYSRAYCKSPWVFMSLGI